jgi:hypothetical protein
MGMETSGLSASDVLALSRSDDGGLFGGGSAGGILALIIVFILLFGNGGWGGNGNSAAVQGALTRADLCQDMNFQELSNSVRGVQSGICDGFYAMNTGILNGFNGVQRDMCTGFSGVNSAITQVGYQMQDCCCRTNSNIDSLKYENAQNTCSIVDAIKADGEATRALINANTMQELRDKLQEAQFQNSQCAQNAYLINQLLPTAKPAYIVNSPYQSAYGIYGYNYGATVA